MGAECDCRVYWCARCRDQVRSALLADLLHLDGLARLPSATDPFEDLLSVFRVDQDLVVRGVLSPGGNDLEGGNRAGHQPGGEH